MSSERFVWYPRRLVQAMQRRELTYDQFALAVLLCGIANYTTHTVEVAILDLKARLWRCGDSDDKIRRDLHALKTGKWVDFDVEERQRGPWVIRLTGLLVREREEASAATNGASAAMDDDSLRQSTAAGEQSEEHAIPHGERDGGAPSLLHGSQAPSTSTSLRVGEDFLGGGDSEDEAGSFSLESLEPDVRDAVERGRRARRESENGVGLSDTEIEFYATARLDEIADRDREEHA